MKSGVGRRVSILGKGGMTGLVFGGAFGLAGGTLGMALGVAVGAAVGELAEQAYLRRMAQAA